MVIEKRPVFWVAAGYALTAALYILLSDTVMFALWPESAAAPSAHIGKGLGFVAVTTLALAAALIAIRSVERERYRAIFDNHHSVMLLVDPVTTRIVDANQGAAAFYGWTPRELVGKSMADLDTLPQEEVKASLHSAALQPASQHHFRHRLANGELRDVRVLTGPVVGRSETLLFSIVHDETEQRLAERALAKADRLLRLLSHTNQLIARAQDQRELLQGVCEIALLDGLFSLAWVALAQADQAIRPVARAGADGGLIDQVIASLHPEDPNLQGPAERALGSGVHLTSNDVTTDARMPQWRPAFAAIGVRSLTAIPLRIGKKVVGSLNLYAAEPDYFSPPVQASLRELGADISLGLENLLRLKALDTMEALVNASPVVLFRVRMEPGLPIEFATSNVERWGYSHAHIAGTPFVRLVHPDDLAATADEVKAHLAAGHTAFSHRYRILTARGDVVWVEHSTVVLRNTLGEIIALQGTVRDVTRAVQAEHAATVSEQRYRDLFASIPHPMLAYDAQTQEILEVNDAAIEKYGYSREEFMRLTVTSIHAADQAAAQAQLGVHPSGLTTEHDLWTHRCKGGQLFMAEERSSALQQQGRAMIILSIEDVTVRMQAKQALRDHVKRIERTMTGTVEAISSMMDLRDPYTAGHERRVGDLAAAIGKELGLGDEQQRGLRTAGAVHDVGKITVPAEILTKPSKLSPIELDIVRTHAAQGYEVLKSVEFPWPVAEVAWQHHERHDGSGYPRGLAGEAILLEARIMAVADVVESMASHRPYRPALGVAAALGEIESRSGQLYDPAVAAACLRLFRERGYQLP